jgi:hypothetical protein
MNWRRGILLSAIHLVIAGSIISWEEARLYKQEHHARADTALSLRMAAFQEEVEFDPCNGGYVDYFTTPAERIVKTANLPAWSLVQWRTPCPRRWTLAGLIRSKAGLEPMQQDLVLALILCILVPIQWLLIGGFPLAKPNRWWAEPGATITICAAVAVVLIPVSLIDRSGIGAFAVELPMLVALLAWFWLFGQLIWNALRFGWARVFPA